MKNTNENKNTNYSNKEVTKPMTTTESNKSVVKEVKKGEVIESTSFVVEEKYLPENFNPFNRVKNPKFANRRIFTSDFEERVLHIKRVIKTTKGGRRFKFSSLVVVGNKKGLVGFAVGKHIEVPESIKKGVRKAKKNLYRIEIVGEQKTIAHNIIGKHGAAKVLLKPANDGKGIIASDTIRSIVELAGIKNIYSKNLGTNNKHNVVLATIKGLSATKTKQSYDFLRDKNQLKKQEVKSVDA